MRALAALALAVVLGIRPGAAVTVPGSDGALDVDGYVDGLAVIDTGGGPRQRPQAIGVVRADGRALPWLRGRLELRSRIGGPFEGGHQGVYNFVHTYQNRSPSLEVGEAYADLALAHTDVRIGIQKLAWGRLDGLPPTDVVNPRDYHDPFVTEVEEAKIGVPALAATHHLRPPPGTGIGELRFSLAWMPFAVPPRLAEIEERWFPTSLDPSAIVLPRRRVELALERILDDEVIVPKDVKIPGTLHTTSRRPPKQLDAGGIGGRLAGTWRGMDFSLSHYTGPDTGPDVDLRPVIILESFDLNPTTGVAELKLRSRSDLRQAHDMMHMTGVDWATTFGPTTMRAEAALFQDRLFLRNASDLFSPAEIRHQLTAGSQALFGHGRTRVDLPPLFPALDAFEWGLGADYTLRSVFMLAQVSEIVLLEDAPSLLIGDPTETRLAAVLRRPFLQDRVEVELRGVYALERGGWFAFPRVSWLIRDDIRLRLGYLAVGGPRTSLFGQFGRNDEVCMQLRYSY